MAIKTITIEQHAYVCDICGEEQLSSWLTKVGAARAALHDRWLIDGDKATCHRCVKLSEVQS